LLRQIGVPFEIVAVDDSEPELNISGVTPARLAEDIAHRKMRAVAESHPGRLVLAADTLVVIGDTILGKPATASEAEEMLLRLSGKTHQVVTGVALGCYQELEVRSLVKHALTEVTFAGIEPETIRAYVATGEPMDKAGAYGIQGKAACFVEQIKGCYANVVGLPLQLVARMLEEFGLSLAGIWSDVGSRASPRIVWGDD